MNFTIYLQRAILQEQIRVRVDGKNVGVDKAVLSRTITQDGHPRGHFCKNVARSEAAVGSRTAIFRILCW